MGICDVLKLDNSRRGDGVCVRAREAKIRVSSQGGAALHRLLRQYTEEGYAGYEGYEGYEDYCIASLRLDRPSFASTIDQTVQTLKTLKTPTTTPGLAPIGAQPWPARPMPALGFLGALAAGRSRAWGHRPALRTQGRSPGRDLRRGSNPTSGRETGREVTESRRPPSTPWRASSSPAYTVCPSTLNGPPWPPWPWPLLNPRVLVPLSRYSVDDHCIACRSYILCSVLLSCCRPPCASHAASPRRFPRATMAHTHAADQKKDNVVDVIESRSDGGEKGSSIPSIDLKLDSKGLPLVPQPSAFKDDPLVSIHNPITIPPLSDTAVRIGLRGSNGLY